MPLRALDDFGAAIQAAWREREVDLAKAQPRRRRLMPVQEHRGNALAGFR